jgi:hypothetical protein
MTRSTPEARWADLYSGDATVAVKTWSNWRNGGAFAMQAVAAIDMACWDIAGKALGQPVYNLIGGRYRDKIRTYTYLYKWAAGEAPEQAGEAALALVERGFTALKLDPIPPYFPQPRDVSLKEIDYTEKVLRAIRDAVGDRRYSHRNAWSLTTHSAIVYAKASNRSARSARGAGATGKCKGDGAGRLHTSIPIATGERPPTSGHFSPCSSCRQHRFCRSMSDLTALESRKIAAWPRLLHAQIAP